jgi:hypothetical protein
MAFGLNQDWLAFKRYLASPVSSTALQLPTILHIPDAMKSHRPTVRLRLSEETLIDASEYLNAVYDDLSQINDILSFHDPTLSIEGTALFYEGFEVLSSLEPIYLQALSRLALFHGFFDGDDKVIVDSFELDQNELSLAEECDSSFEADDEYVNEMVMDHLA